MKQNKYDEAEFFDNYSKMARSVQGLDAAGEWHELQTLLPDLKDKRVPGPWMITTMKGNVWRTF